MLTLITIVFVGVLVEGIIYAFKKSPTKDSKGEGELH